VHYVGPKGVKAPKVFKWKAVPLGPGEGVVIRKQHPFRNVSIRQLYPGVHRIEVQVNGKVLTGGELSLTDVNAPSKEPTDS